MKGNRTTEARRRREHIAFVPRLPAEWEPQAGVILVWPHAGTDWAEDLVEAESVYRELAQTISRFEDVLIVCRDAELQDRVASSLCETAAPTRRIHFAICAANDTWVRDFGPLTIEQDGRARLIDFRFNAWGGKFDFELDDRVTAHLVNQGSFGTRAIESSPVILEGGAIESDGAGTLLLNRHAVIDDRRNPGLSQAEMEQELRARLGAQRILWLEHGHLTGDDTDGHIDTLARFVDQRTIVHASCPSGDPDFAELDAMAAELAALRSTEGQPYQLIPLPSPGEVLDEDGRRLPAGYANFLIINGAVLVPTYRVPADVEALSILTRAFPERQIIGIDCLPLVRQNGSLHCVTMQLPLGVSIETI